MTEKHVWLDTESGLTIQIPICPDCARPLEMLERYMWAPSLAWCPGCCEGPYDVAFDHDARRWDIIPLKTAQP